MTRGMLIKNALLALAVLGCAMTIRPAHAGVEEKKARDAIDEAMAKASADIKDCGKKIKVVFDWKAYDALDWKKIGHEKKDYYGNELNSVKELGTAVNKLCGDKDYKAALGKIGTITYRSTNDDTIRVKAVVSGSSLTFENYTFGSTRGSWDYETAAKAAL